MSERPPAGKRRCAPASPAAARRFLLRLSLTCLLTAPSAGAPQGKLGTSRSLPARSLRAPQGPPGPTRPGPTRPARSGAALSRLPRRPPQKFGQPPPLLALRPRGEESCRRGWQSLPAHSPRARQRNRPSAPAPAPRGRLHGDKVRRRQREGFPQRECETRSRERRWRREPAQPRSLTLARRKAHSRPPACVLTPPPTLIPLLLLLLPPFPRLSQGCRRPALG